MKGTCAVITGAGMGLGRMLADECAERGLDLLLVALPGSDLNGVSRTIRRNWNVSVETLEADLTDATTIGEILSIVRGKELPVGLLINNAGVGTIGAFETLPPEQHRKTILLNVLALVELTRALLPELKRHGDSRILNVASLSAFYPMPSFCVYSATKSFVLNYSLALRNELAGEVGVSVLCPNTIRTTPDVNAYIDRQGVLARLACLPADRIARTALRQCVQNKAVIVPGGINRLLAAVSHCVPHSLSMPVIRRLWGTYAREMETAGRP